jgi:hypothetical protein
MVGEPLLKVLRTIVESYFYGSEKNIQQRTYKIFLLFAK